MTRCTPLTTLRCRISASALALLAASAAAGDMVAFDEVRDGDASDDRLSPSFVALAGGINTIRGTFGKTEIVDVHDLDYITFTVPEGFALSSFFLHAASVGGAFSFVGLQAGPLITIPADWTSIETPLLGWSHFGSASVGSDLLAEMAISPGSVGFSGPLPAGTYALWIMELDTSEYHTYDFSLGVTPVPGPATLLAAAVFLPFVARRRR